MCLDCKFLSQALCGCRFSNFYRLFLTCLVCFCSQNAYAAPIDSGVDYDIVYVAYPEVDEDAFGNQIADPSKIPLGQIPQGEKAYIILGGADLMLLRADGTKETLVDCDRKCSVMDPFVSFDGKYVYYSKIENIDPYNRGLAGGYIWKIDLTKAAPRKEIQLTFDDGFDSQLYAGNDSPDSYLSNYRKLRDMAPFPVAGGKLGFTSNRSGLISPAVTTSSEGASVQQIYVMDDHDGSKKTAEAANMRRLEAGSLQMVQHPMQLMDGSILFTSWHAAATKYIQQYAMSTLFLVDADGSNLRQYTEPHDHARTLDHFITQLSDESIVWGNYYPSYDYGYGILNRAPLEVAGPDYIRKAGLWRDYVAEGGTSREFERVGLVNMTPHTIGGDSPAPSIVVDGQVVGSGKYSMPSAAPNGHMLVAYSKGYVNHFPPACVASNPKNNGVNKCEKLRSGIYLIKNAAKAIVDDPTDTNLMIPVLDDPGVNEIWPRAVVPYQEVYGIPQPRISRKAPLDDRLAPAETAALMGTSSMLNMDTSDNSHSFRRNDLRGMDNGEWTIQGAEAGRFTDEDVHAVRIVAIEPVVGTRPVKKNDGSLASSEKYKPECIVDNRIPRIHQKYCSAHQESWKILGEFILPHTSEINARGKKDTSWIAKVPAETPLLIQTLDRNGMTLVSELTWRALKAGEKRADCGGCHVHAGQPLDYEVTASGRRRPIAKLPGVDDNDARISDGMIDLSKGASLLSDDGMVFVPEKQVGIEYYRDVLPIIERRCVGCHTAGADNGGLVLDSSNGADAWTVLHKDAGIGYPQVSRYIRTPQARESFLIWNVYGSRLDGRSNDERSNDIDFTGHPEIIGLTSKEKRVFARWVDLGSPKDLVESDGFGYTHDNSLPIINIMPKSSVHSATNSWLVAFGDSESGIDHGSINVKVFPLKDGVQQASINLELSEEPGDDVYGFTVPDNVGSFIVRATVSDLVGNKAVVSVSAKPRPNAPTGSKYDLVYKYSQ